MLEIGKGKSIKKDDKEKKFVATIGKKMKEKNDKRKKLKQQQKKRN